MRALRKEHLFITILIHLFDVPSVELNFVDRAESPYGSGKGAAACVIVVWCTDAAEEPV